ncbi:hypothetical protein BGZ51_006840 [Haplosporangium sp. Z 767]|nr:hypothetical protein BGZ51_006840 [Haplosporangium sp. Z 767]
MSATNNNHSSSSSSNGNSNGNGPRITTNHQFHQNPTFKPVPVPVHTPGQIPPFIDPRVPNRSPSHFPQPPRHPLPPVKFPTHPHQPQHQHAGFHNRPIIGAPPMVRPAHQAIPTGAAFHTMVHAQNMYPIRTSSGTTTSSTAAVTSPTQPPNRKLPPIPVEENNTNSKSSKSSKSSKDSSTSSKRIIASGIIGSSILSEGVAESADRQQTIRSGIKEIQQMAEELQSLDSSESEFDRSVQKGLEMTATATTICTAGTMIMNQGISVADKAINSPKVQDIASDEEKNPALSHLIQMADKLVDIGKVLPFIAPAFIIIKLIIDVEQKARDVDTKCTDMIERISFLVSNLTVLEKIKTIDPLVAVIEKTNDTLKQAAALIQAYRKQGSIARRLNLSNTQNFAMMAEKITACSNDLMLSLQIQQTGDLSILTKGIPVDPQDEEAKKFVAENGGQNAINNNPKLVEEFAKKMHFAMSGQVMEQMQSNMESILEENQSRIETMVKENSSNAVADAIKALATEVREREAEQRLVCLQCDKEYRESANGPEACSFHKSIEIRGSYSCCGKKAPCTFSNHRAVHHCEYPYTSFFDYAYEILRFTDTTDEWATISEKNLLTDDVLKATVGRLIRWRTRHEKISKPMMLIHLGRINFESSYYFQVFDAEGLEATNATIRNSGNTVIFKSSKAEDEYEMAEWTLDDSGLINGVKLSVKARTNEVPTVVVAPIDIMTVSLSDEVRTLSKATFKTYKPAGPYVLPEVRHVGYSLRTTPLRKVREFKAKTKLPVVVTPEGTMVANTNGRFVRNDSDKFQGTIRIFNKAPPSSQTYVTLASCKAEYRLVGDKEYKSVETLNLEDTKFPASIAPAQSLDVPFEAIVPRNAAQAELMQSCWYWAMVALHHPIRVRLTFKDIEGEELVYVQEYIHEPSRRLASKEDKDILFLHIDNALDASRSVVRVKKGEGDYLVNINGNQLSVEDLNKIVFEAEQSSVTEVELKYGRECGSYQWKVWALVDLSCRCVYAFKVLLEEGPTCSKKTSAALGYAPCPMYGGGDIEERPIQYAEEKVTFPDLDPEETIVVVEDDDVDDEKPVVTIQTAEPAIAAAAAASASVTAALSEVPKATSSLDSAVFSASMASLEKRLESLDTNVARMATALEKLVDILSP